MKVSVIVPVYNVEEYLPKCLDSLVNQTLKDIEIIIVNDDSPDNSQNIIDEYAKKYKNIRAFQKKNGGLSDARNYGLKYVTGEYISFIDSDDYIDEAMLEKMYNKAVNDDLDIVVCNSVEVYTNKQILKKSNFNYSNDVIKNYLLAPPMACGRIYKKYLFDKVKFTKNIFYEDLNLSPSFVKITNKIDFLDEGLYYYVQRSNSIMNQSKFNEKELDIFKVLDNNRKKLYNDYPNEIEYLYISHLLRSASLRFADYDNAYMLINKIADIMKEKYPNYNKNIYYKKSSLKFKIICFFACRRQIKVLRLIKRVGELR